MSEYLERKSLITNLLKIAAHYDADEILQLVVDTCPKLVRARNSSIYWIDRRTSSVILRSTFPENRGKLEKESYLLGEGLTGWVAKSGTLLNVKDIEDSEELKAIDPELEWSDKFKHFENATNKKYRGAFLAAPIQIDGTTVGVFRIGQSIKPDNKFTQDDIDLVSLFTKYLSQILKKTSLIDRSEKLDKLICHTDIKDLDGYLNLIANSISVVLDADACSIFLENSSDKIVLKATSYGNELSSKIGKASYNKMQGATGWVYGTGGCVRESDLKAYQLNSKYPKLKWEEKFSEFNSSQVDFLAAPIKTKYKIIGVIRLIKKWGELPFSLEDEKLITSFCAKLGMLIDSYTHSSSDSITVNPHWPGRFPVVEDLVYVLMPYSQDWSDNVKHEIKHSIECHSLKMGIASDQHGRVIMQDVWQGISQAKIVIADLTGCNANVAYEVGMVDTLGKDIILITQDVETLPFDFLGARVIIYDCNQLSNLHANLSKNIEVLLEKENA